MNLKEHVNREVLKNIIFIILGTLIAGIGINMFISNAQLLSGGVSGVGLIVQYVFKIPSGYIVLAANIPLLYLSYKKMDSKFTFYTVVGSIAFSIMLILTMPLKKYVTIEDPLLLSLYGGILNGLGIGICFSNYGSTGGVDIVCFVVRKKFNNLDIGKIALIINAIIVSVGAGIFGIEKALYTLVSMYCTSYMIDKVIKGFDRDKLILIITEKEEIISKTIMNKLQRGVTFLYGEGAYTNKSRKILYCVVPLGQLPKLKKIVKEIDEKAFISILDVSEVEGQGFKKRVA